MTFESDLRIVIDIFTKLSLDKEEDLIFIQNFLLLLKGELDDAYESVYMALHKKYQNYIKYKVTLEFINGDGNGYVELREGIKINLFESQTENTLKIIDKIFFNDLYDEDNNQKLLNNIGKEKIIPITQVDINKLAFDEKLSSIPILKKNINNSPEDYTICSLSVLEYANDEDYEGKLGQKKIRLSMVEDNKESISQDIFNQYVNVLKSLFQVINNSLQFDNNIETIREIIILILIFLQDQMNHFYGVIWERIDLVSDLSSLHIIDTNELEFPSLNPETSRLVSKIITEVKSKSGRFFSPKNINIIDSEFLFNSPFNYEVLSNFLKDKYIVVTGITKRKYYYKSKASHFLTDKYCQQVGKIIIENLNSSDQNMIELLKLPSLESILQKVFKSNILGSSLFYLANTLGYTYQAYLSFKDYTSRAVTTTRKALYALGNKIRSLIRLRSATGGVLIDDDVSDTSSELSDFSLTNFDNANLFLLVDKDSLFLNILKLLYDISGSKHQDKRQILFNILNQLLNAFIENINSFSQKTLLKKEPSDSYKVYFENTIDFQYFSTNLKHLVDLLVVPSNHAGGRLKSKNIISCKSKKIQHGGGEDIQNILTNFTKGLTLPSLIEFFLSLKDGNQIIDQLLEIKNLDQTNKKIYISSILDHLIKIINSSQSLKVVIESLIEKGLLFEILEIINRSLKGDGDISKLYDIFTNSDILDSNNNFLKVPEETLYEFKKEPGIPPKIIIQQKIPCVLNDPEPYEKGSMENPFFIKLNLGSNIQSLDFMNLIRDRNICYSDYTENTQIHIPDLNENHRDIYYFQVGNQLLSVYQNNISQINYKIQQLNDKFTQNFELNSFLYFLEQVFVSGLEFNIIDNNFYKHLKIALIKPSDLNDLIDQISTNIYIILKSIVLSVAHRFTGDSHISLFQNIYFFTINIAYLIFNLLYSYKKIGLRILTHNLPPNPVETVIRAASQQPISDSLPIYLLKLFQLVSNDLSSKRTLLSYKKIDLGSYNSWNNIFIYYNFIVISCLKNESFTGLIQDFGSKSNDTYEKIFNIGEIISQEFINFTNNLINLISNVTDIFIHEEINGKLENLFTKLFKLDSDVLVPRDAGKIITNRKPRLIKKISKHKHTKNLKKSLKGSSQNQHSHKKLLITSNLKNSLRRKPNTKHINSAKIKRVVMSNPKRSSKK